MTITALQYHQAVAILRSGGIIAYPTEAVFGLGCDPDCKQAVNRLCTIKQRSQTKGFILIADDYRHLLPYIDEKSVPLTALARAQRTWPGPITWVFPASTKAPPWLLGPAQTIAVRVSAFEAARCLCQQFGKALVSTSANLATEVPLKDAAAVRTLFHDQIDYILDAPVGSANKPTEIRDVITHTVLRA